MLYFATVIEWTSILFNGFWIFGCAIILAAFSFHHWQAQLEKTRLREQLERPSFEKPFWIGFFFIGLGLVTTSSRWWETIIWGIFVVLSLFNFYKVYKQSDE